MDKLYTCTEIAQRYTVPKQTVWLWIRQKKLLAIKIGREYRIRQCDVELFENERKTS